MFMNPDGAQIGGRLFAFGAAYALISLFITGPVIGERMVAKIGWAAQCQRLINNEVAAQQPVVKPTPKLGCNDIFGTLFGREGSDFCSYYGPMLDENPITQSIDAAADAQREAEAMRRELAVSRASTRCECAVTTTLEDRRVPLAIYGGSARLVTPPSIRLLASDLEVNLNGPDCAMKG